MAKRYSFTVLGRDPLSQNNRTRALLNTYSDDLCRAFGNCNPTTPVPLAPMIMDELYGKVYYFHKVKDKKDADNLSKPLWDALNEKLYDDDYQIKFRESAKLFADPLSTYGINVSNAEPKDYDVIVDFFLNPVCTATRLLYIEIGDFDCKMMKCL